MACAGCGKDRIAFLKSILEKIENGEVVQSNKHFRDLQFSENIEEIKKELDTLIANQTQQ